MKKIIKKAMENFYDDELLPDNFEQIAKAYSKKLKDKGFVFVRLEEEELSLLVSEIFVILFKMRACTQKLFRVADCQKLNSAIEDSLSVLEETFGKTKFQKFSFEADENSAFLCLISLQNLLFIKLMLLSVKSGQFEVCNQVTTSIASVFAESFSTESFKLV